MEHLIRGKRQVLLIRVHEVGQAAPEEDWLRRNTQLFSEDRFDNASVLYFTPIEGATLPRQFGPYPLIDPRVGPVPKGGDDRVPVRR